MSDLMKLSDALTKDEMRSLREKSDLKAFATLTWNWGLIAAAFAIAIVWTNPFTILLGILILGGRQLGLGIINHDCAHHAFFKNKAVDDFVGEWLVGAPMNISLAAYRAYHLKHHKYAGTPDDPDIVFLRMDLGEAEIWDGDMGVLDVAKMALGMNVHEDAEKDHVKETAL